MPDKKQDHPAASEEKNGTIQPSSAPEAVSGTPGKDINFIKEKVKERPVNRKKLLRRTVTTASMAVIFGLIACLTFLVLEPVLTNWLYPEKEPDPVQLQEEAADEEMLPKDMILETETQEETAAVTPPAVVQKAEMSVADYQKLYSSLSKLMQESSKALVTVTAITSDTDWFNNSYENEGQNAGLIVADNGKEFLILTEKETVESAEKMEVTFYDGTQKEATLKQTDPTTGLAVICVSLSELTEETISAVAVAKLASSSNSGLLATPVMALGRPMGMENSAAYGIITSTDTVVNLEDGNYQLLTTDIYGSTLGSGFLFNMSGQVLGVISQENSREDMPNLITALGISTLRNNIEKLSNGQPTAYLGIYGADVPKDIQETGNVPAGACVTGIVMDSPAMVAGIQSGDVIVQMGTEEISSFGDYNRVLMNLLPDTEVTLTVMRQGQDEYQEMTVDVLLDTLE